MSFVTGHLDVRIDADVDSPLKREARNVKPTATTGCGYVRFPPRHLVAAL
jgi:hypothetical protein